MAEKISIEPDKLESLANSVVKELALIEDINTDLKNALSRMILNVDSKFAHCFSVVDTYGDAGDKLIDKMDDVDKDLRKVSEKMAEADNTLQFLYGLYDKYGTVTGMGVVAANQMKYLLTGLTDYTLGANGLWSFKHYGPFASLAAKIDASEYRNVARGFLGLKYLKKKFASNSFADLVHMKFAKYLPQDVVNYTNSFQGFIKGAVNEAGEKFTFGQVMKTGWKFAKTSAPMTALITAGTELTGMGLDIAGNYEKYGNNTEVLKRENAKAVGRAVYKTGVVTGFSVAGAALGGAAGTFLGPGGTIVVGALGATAGGIVGEVVAESTQFIAEDVALVFKDQIHSGVEHFRGTMEKVGKVAGKVDDAIEKGNDMIKEGKKAVDKGLKKVSDTASSLVKDAGHFFSKPLFG
ncbi:hypothetical protein CEF21_21090 [Bacillus sp. FJAT-42376]|uniref:hypothetical protein n=1 Tax=Bacillus sp. FJAT-42376 TaxID=2014076 RepID=UPI000F4F3963|nr:hypothetical protein [Bacillus sp. FJAT-42376]AZB44579.1 hypothetical protein CEF21_21090 [Bacillus sp. FJAT-42376]